MSRPGLPYFTAGVVVKGSGNGSKKLGIPTANFASEVLQNLPPELVNGVYHGWASINGKDVHKMVLSIGWDPVNSKKTMDVHIIHEYPENFYGLELRIVILGFLRHKQKYNSVEALIAGIKADIEVAKKLLEDPQLTAYKTDTFFTDQNPAF